MENSKSSLPTQWLERKEKGRGGRKKERERAAIRILRFWFPQTSDFRNRLFNMHYLK